MKLRLYRTYVLDLFEEGRVVQQTRHLTRRGMLRRVAKARRNLQDIDYFEVQHD